MTDEAASEAASALTTCVSWVAPTGVDVCRGVGATAGSGDGTARGRCGRVVGGHRPAGRRMARVCGVVPVVRLWATDETSSSGESAKNQDTAQNQDVEQEPMVVGATSGTVKYYLLGDKTTQSAGYGVLGLLHTVLSGAQLVDAAMYGIDVLGVVGLSFTNLAITIATLYSLREAVIHERLGSDTYKRLNMGLISNSVVTSLTALRHAIFFSPILLKCMMAVHLGTALFALRVWVMSNKGVKPVGVLRKSLSSVRRSFKAKNGTSAIYALLTVGLTTISAFALLVRSPSPYSNVAPLLASMRLWASQQLFLHAAVLYSLKDASDRGRLNASTFRQLNTGVAMSFGGRSVLCLRRDGQGMTPMVLYGCIALFAMYTLWAGRRRADGTRGSDDVRT